MAELADAHDSGSCGATRAGSSPVIRTKKGTSFTCSFFLSTMKFTLFFYIQDKTAYQPPHPLRMFFLEVNRPL